MPTTVEVRTGDRPYEVVIGAGTRHLLPGIVERLGACRAVVVSARPEPWVPDPGIPSTVIPAHDGEHAKTLATVEDLCARFAAFGLGRSDVVVACGGGTTTDVAGLAAALYHRGVAVVHVPTTLLAQVDASVGGKTAVNLPAGKNLVGAYWQPAAVLCDTDYLSTLPPRQRRNGLGEIARCHFIGAGDLSDLTTEEQIAASIALKADVVSRDERDTGLRHILNYGHTLGHALEIATGFRLYHGEAVAVGTVFVGRLAHSLGRIGAARAIEHDAVVRRYGLPAALPEDVTAEDLIGIMRHDKKAVEGLSFVLDGDGGPALVVGVAAETVRRVLGEMPRQPLGDLVAEVADPAGTR